MKLFVLVLSFICAFSVQAITISIKSKDGFVLEADYLAGEMDTPAVLLLHQCDRNRHMYDNLALSLNQMGFHTLALDFRMFGGSVDKTQNQKVIRAAATSREDYFKTFNAIQALWPEDVIVAKEYLQSQKGVKQGTLATVGASCGGDQQLILNKAMPDVKAQVFLSTPLAQTSLQQISDTRHVPRLFVVGSLDPVNNTTLTMPRGYDQSTSNYSQMLSYKSEAHGEPLFKEDPLLITTISVWLQRQLSR